MSRRVDDRLRRAEAARRIEFLAERGVTSTLLEESEIYDFVAAVARRTTPVPTPRLGGTDDLPTDQRF